MINLRAPLIEELPVLSELCMRSKAHWGYDAAFMEACREEITITTAIYHQGPMQIAYDNNQFIGVTQVVNRDDHAELEMFYIEPDRMGMGAGRTLFAWAVSTARSMKVPHLRIESDPQACAFYLHMGARKVGEAPSGSIVGRMLPLLEFTLD